MRLQRPHYPLGVIVSKPAMAGGAALVASPVLIAWHIDLDLLQPGAGVLFAALAIMVLAWCRRAAPRGSIVVLSAFVTILHLVVLYRVLSPLAGSSLALPSAWILILVVGISVWQAIPFVIAWAAHVFSGWYLTWFGPVLGGGLIVGARALWPSPFPGGFHHPFALTPALNAPASLLGFLGYEWLVTTTLLGVAALAAQRRSREGIALVVACAAVFAAAFVLRAHSAAGAPPAGLPLMVIQDGLLTDGPSSIIDTLDAEIERSPDTRLVVLPESGILMDDYGDPLDRRHLLAGLRSFAARHDVHVLFMWYRADGDGDRVASSVLLSPDGSLAMRDKRLLLPFGEYLPVWAPYAGYLGISRERREWARFRPGERNDPFVVDGVHIQVLVCYESIFPHFVARLLDPGAIQTDVP